jgi:hypothetical protein
LWREQGKVQQSRELFAPVYWWFTEANCSLQFTVGSLGFGTRDLKEAKALLEELAA